MTVAEFLIERLENIGVSHVFGIPGDYILDFYAQLWNNPKIKIVNTADESGAGFAADAHARAKGIGCVCVTYNVGALKIANAVACAYAERSPLIVISGSPGLNERKNGMLLHHMVRSFECQKEIFQKITCASAILDNPNTAAYEIDRVLEVLKYHKQPVYIELPRDVAKKSINYDVWKQGTPVAPKTDIDNLNEALVEVAEWIDEAANPVIIAGVQVARHGLGESLVKFAERTNIPIVATLLSKSVVNERHPLFAGIYMGDASNEFTRRLVDGSDCVLMFGVLRTDMTLCFKPTVFPKRQVVSCSIESLKVKNHTYTDVGFIDFCEALFDNSLKLLKRTSPELPIKPERKSFVPEDKKVTTARFFEKIDSILDKNMAVVADIGDTLFGASDLTMHHKNLFLSPAFYTTMGFAIPGALGLGLSNPNVRTIVLVGDGAFQMSFAEISTMLENNLSPIIFVLNNHGYTTERFLKEGDFNNIREWNYEQVDKVFNGGIGLRVETEIDLEKATQFALANKNLYVINVLVEVTDISLALKRFTEALSKRI